jgi:hypothetical protein
MVSGEKDHQMLFSVMNRLEFLSYWAYLLDVTAIMYLGNTTGNG